VTAAAPAQSCLTPSGCPFALASAGQINTIRGFESGTDVLEFVQGLLAEKDGSTAALAAWFRG
jgi:hypothetical protein